MDNSSQLVEMQNDLGDLASKITYTELVYGRVNKKLGTTLSKEAIESMVLGILKNLDESRTRIQGKNYYITNEERTIRLTINQSTKRLITVARINRD